MNNNRKSAIIVGVLYIIGTVAGILSLVVATPLLDAPDYLVLISANAKQLALGALFVLTMGLALAMIPVVMYPILKIYNPVLALGYVVFRGALETVTYLVLAISWLSLAAASQAYAQAGAAAALGLAVGNLLQATAETSSTMTEIIFPLGALMFYYVLYQSRLIPRWISGWGLIAVFPYLAAGLLHMLGILTPLSPIQSVMVLPMALQEMVMAVWLIVKGFNPAAIASEPAPVDRTVYKLAPQK
jgi:Domain of unknown function (DUF4386)